MKAILLLLLFIFIYSAPNPIYVIKDCTSKLIDLDNSFYIDLLQWRVDVFYDKLDAIDPTLRPKVKECVKMVNKHFDLLKRRP